MSRKDERHRNGWMKRKWKGTIKLCSLLATVMLLTLETISLCVLLCLRDFNNLLGQSCRYSTFKNVGTVSVLRCVCLNSSPFIRFSYSHNGPPPLSLALVCHLFYSLSYSDLSAGSSPLVILFLLLSLFASFCLIKYRETALIYKVFYMKKTIGLIGKMNKEG